MRCIFKNTVCILLFFHQTCYSNNLIKNGGFDDTLASYDTATEQSNRYDSIPSNTLWNNVQFLCGNDCAWGTMGTNSQFVAILSNLGIKTSIAQPVSGNQGVYQLVFDWKGRQSSLGVGSINVFWGNNKIGNTIEVNQNSGRFSISLEEGTSFDKQLRIEFTGGVASATCFIEDVSLTPVNTTDVDNVDRSLWRAKFGVPANIVPTLDDDYDGVSNIQEALSGTNPYDKLSKFNITSSRKLGNKFELKWNSEKGVDYRMQTSIDGKSWNYHAGTYKGTGIDMSVTVTNSVLMSSKNRLFRMSTLQDLDTDSDGLYDWQEEIVGSNPLDPYSLNTAANGGDLAHYQSLTDAIYGGASNQAEGVSSDSISEKNAARFLNQSSMGPNADSIQSVIDLGYEAWINQQLTVGLDPISKKPIDNLQNYTSWIFANRTYDNDVRYHNRGTRTDMPCENVTTQWLRNALWSEAQLRQRVTWALSQIFVVSAESTGLFSRGDMLANYYDMLSENAFGRYDQLLYKVSLHPAMGAYLSHMFNKKAGSNSGRLPDENYAREIMQLFSIGLYQLNMDGSPKLDSNGKVINTYTTQDIKEMARVFTGLQLDGRPWGGFPFGGDASLSKLMKTNAEFHDADSKRMPDGTIIAANTNGLMSISETIRWLANHPNTAPFISTRLIQLLVTSNPSPRYIQRVSSVFANDGNGIRGNLGAVVKAILLDEEARGLNYLTDPYFGRLKEPMLRITNTARALEAHKHMGTRVDASSDTFQYWNLRADLGTGQYPLYAKSVFNYFDLRYQFPGEITNNKKLSPEFQILDVVTATASINRMRRDLYSGNYNDLEDEGVILRDGTQSTKYSEFGPKNDWSKLEAIASNPDPRVLCDKVLVLWGAAHSISYRTRDRILEAIQDPSFTNRQKANNAAFLAILSPECVIQR